MKSSKLIALLATWCCVLTLLGGKVRAKDLNLFAWSEYVPQEVIDGFTKETGIKVNYETYDSNEAMLAKLKSGATKYDLIQPSDYTVEALTKEKLLAELDKSKLPNLKNIGKQYLNQGHDPDQKYSVPWMCGTVGIIYNSEKVPGGIKGYKDLFQASHKGRIVVPDDAREMVTWALKVNGKSVNDVSPENLAIAKKTVAGWIPLIKMYDSTSPKKALIEGEVDMGIVWSGEAATCWQENKKFKYVLAEEGSHRFIDNLVIPANSENKEAAHQFINYILRPEVSKIISDKFPYTNPNLEARKLLSKEQLENPASYPEGADQLEIFRDIGDTAAEIDKIVTDLRAGG